MCSKTYFHSKRKIYFPNTHFLNFSLQNTPGVELVVCGLVDYLRQKERKCGIVWWLLVNWTWTYRYLVWRRIWKIQIRLNVWIFTKPISNLLIVTFCRFKQKTRKIHKVEKLPFSASLKHPIICFSCPFWTSQRYFRVLIS